MRDGRPNIVLVATACPFADSFGAQLRTLQTVRALQQVGNLSSVLVSFHGWPEDALERTRQNLELAGVGIYERVPIRGLQNRLRHEFDPTFMNTHGFLAPPALRQQVQGLAEQADLVWVHTAAVANAFRQWQWPRTVLDVDDLRSSYHLTRANSASNVGERLNSYRRARIEVRRERKFRDRFDALVVCSDHDVAPLRAPSRTFVVPNGFPSVPSFDANRREAARIGVIGTMEYAPNREGVRWFLQKVWGKIKAAVPSAEFRIIGKGSDPAWAAIDGVSTLGFVDDPTDEMATWSVMAVPLRIGAGTRVKIAEAFARGIPVVSTTVGAFGYNVVGGREVLLSDQEPSFAANCVDVLESPELRNRMRNAGLAYYQRNLSEPAISGRIRSVAMSVLESHPYLPAFEEEEGEDYSDRPLETVLD